MNQVAQAYDILHGFVQDRREVPHNTPRSIQSLIDYIHENIFDSGLSVKTAMRDCTLHDNNITSKFRLFVGVGMREYIESLRMEAAAHLLKESDITIMDIAFCIGYEHPQSFYRTFQRSFHCTPADFRKASS